MANKISVLIDVTVDKAVDSLTNFRKSIADADGIVNKFKAGGKAAFDGIKANAATLAAGAVGSFAAIAGSVIKAGAEMEAMDAKAETVFGASLGRVQKWGKENASAMGMTAREATNASAAIADLLKPMGFTEEAATDNSLALMELAGALSAWSGGQRSAAEVSEIFTKAMLGEREELKSLGISISEADVQTRLLEKGQAKLTGTALQQAKAVATQELIYEKSTDAQKAWADGSMDGVKKQNEAKAAVTRLSEVMTESLYPTLVKLVPVVAETAESLLPLAEQMAKVAELAPQVAAALNLTATDSEKLTWAVMDLEEEFRKADAIDEWMNLVTAAAVGATDMEQVLAALTEAQERNAQSTTTAAGTHQTGADVLAMYEAAARRAKEETGELDDGLGRVDRSAVDFAEEVQDAKDEVAKFEKSLEDADEALDRLKANVDERSAWRNMYDSLADLMTLVDSGEASWSDLSEASDDLALSIADVIGSMEEIPPEVKTQLYTELDQGNLDLVRKWIEDFESGIDVPVRWKLPAGASVNKGGQIVGFGGVVIAGATGGIVTKPTMALIGEAGPEAVIPLNQAPGASPLPPNLGVTPSAPTNAGATVHITNHITTQSDPRAVYDALLRQVRLSGGADLRRAMGL